MTAGFGRIFRLLGKRERIISLLWFLGIAGTTLTFGAMFTQLFPDEASVSGMVNALDTPAMTAMMGPVYGTEQLMPVMLMTMQMRIWVMLCAAILSIFFICRHTRNDEELGRWEVLRSLPVGSITVSAAAYTGAVSLQVIIALATASGLLILDLPGTTAAGAFSYSFSIASVGIVFAGVALLMAQLFSTTRGALTSSFAVLGLAYMLRASGDVSQSALSAISPLGLGFQVEAFYSNAAAPILILIAESLAFAVAALLLASRRDLGEGILPARRGKGHAASWMLSPAGLAFRLTRTQILIWAIGLVTIGAVYGSVMGDIETFTASNEMYKQMLDSAGTSYSLSDRFMAMLFGIFSAIAAIPAILHALKIRGEERRGRLDQIFSKSVSRSSMLGSYVAIAFVESILMLTLVAFGFYITASAAVSVSLGTVLQAALVYLPALWVMIGASVLLVGLLPKGSVLVWALYAYVFFMLFYARILSIPEWIIRISPFSNIPQLPATSFEWLPPAVLTLIAAALMWIGFRRFRQRDIQLS